MTTAAQDTNVDTSANQVYNTDQQASPNGDDLEARKSELIERYSATLEQGTAEEIEKVEREIKIFLGEEAPPLAEEAQVPETPPAHQEGQTPNTEATQGATDGAPPASNENGEEWLASLDPKVREIVLQKLDTERKAREYHEQRYKSDIGRTNAYQRKYEDERKAREELERKLREGVPSQPANQQPATPVAQTATARKIQELNERITKLKGTDPELADVLETTRDALLETQQLMASSVPKVDMSSVEELKQKIAHQEQEMLIQNERARLEYLVPGALNVIDYVDPKTKWSPWQEFVSSLPPALSTAANDANADTYAHLMPMYVQWAERYNAAHGFVQPAQEAQQAVSQTNVDPRAAQVQHARQQKLTTSAAAPAKSSPPPAYKPSLEERMKNPPAPGTPEYAKFLEEVDKAVQAGKLEI